MRTIIFTLCMIFVVSLLFGQKPEKRLAGLDEELQEVLETWQTPSFAVAVVEKDKVVYAKGFGYSDYENKVPADANTLYAIGSCSKSFTSAILGQLRDEGHVDFDESPRMYIPGLKFYNDEMNTYVTVKDMMCHRTGLARHDWSWYLFPTDSRDTLMQRMEHQEPFTGVRESWYYNNFMFLLQGVIAEKITGKTWEDNVRERIFKPLGMERSNLSIKELEKSKNAALGYQTKPDGTIEKMDYYRIRAMAPAGSINSSVNEMTKWVQTWIQGGNFNNESILPEGYVREAMSSQMVVGAGLPGKDNPDLHMANYGYGWFLSSYRGHYRVEHGGNIDGFSASTSFFPSDSIGIIVLVNQNGSTVPAVVRNIIVDRMLGLPKIDWSGDLRENYEKGLESQKEGEAGTESNQKKGTKPSHLLIEYAGTYSHPGYGSFELNYERDSLFANFGEEVNYVQHYHYDVFEPFSIEDGVIDTTRSPVLLTFTSNASGDIDGVTIPMEPTVDPIKFKRTPKEIEVTAEDLEPYVGEYELAGTTIKVYIKDENVLYVFVPAQPEYELVATGDHKFVFKSLDGFSVQFQEAEDGKINAVKFNQPNGIFTATKKE
ncbi:MAG: serine hydrolase [Bacteroidetes bacterium]|nr:MAG: serine hydrolase [Bacteroidota bacterium]